MAIISLNVVIKEQWAATVAPRVRLLPVMPENHMGRIPVLTAPLPIQLPAMCLKMQLWWFKSLGPRMHVGDPEDAPVFWLSPVSSPATVDIYRVNHGWKISVFLCLPVCNSTFQINRQINKHKKKGMLHRNCTWPTKHRLFAVLIIFFLVRGGNVCQPRSRAWSGYIIGAS